MRTHTEIQAMIDTLEIIIRDDLVSGRKVEANELRVVINALKYAIGERETPIS